jgi:hypothetical protein
MTNQRFYIHGLGGFLLQGKDQSMRSSLVNSIQYSYDERHRSVIPTRVIRFAGNGLGWQWDSAPADPWEFHSSHAAEIADMVLYHAFSALSVDVVPGVPVVDLKAIILGYVAPTLYRLEEVVENAWQRQGGELPLVPVFLVENKAGYLPLDRTTLCLPCITASTNTLSCIFVLSATDSIASADPPNVAECKKEALHIQLSRHFDKGSDLDRNEALYRQVVAVVYGRRGNSAIWTLFSPSKTRRLVDAKVRRSRICIHRPTMRPRKKICAEFDDFQRVTQEWHTLLQAMKADELDFQVEKSI